MYKEITQSEPQWGASQWNPSGNGREATSHLFPQKLSDYYQDAGLPFLLRSYCGGVSWGGRGLFGVHFHITVHL